MKISVLLLPLLVLALAFPALSTFAASVVQGDGDYEQYHLTDKTFIFPPEYQDLLGKSVQYTQALETFYRKSFGWKLDEHSHYILASSKNQIPNASSTVIPFPLNTFYNGGVEVIDSFAYRSWLATLLIHETAHLYQINPKQDLSRLTKKIFGNHFFFIYPIVPIPVFVHPNVVLPTWLVEGNAVFNECLFGMGGRLFSGEERALFYSLLKAGVLDENRLINEHLSFPFTREKYIVGGYFQFFLAQKYGIDKTNRFFFKHSTHFFNPLRLDSTFRHHFGESYYSNIEEFIQYFSKKAENQLASPEETRAVSLVNLPLNADSEKIFFLTNPDGRSEYLLHTVNKRTFDWTKRPIDLLPGKVFEIEKDVFVSATHGTLTNQEVVFGLWGEGKKLYPEFHSRLVLDMKNDRENKDVLAFDAKTSFDGPQLFLNQQKLGTVHSTALLDDQGHYYYFKQDGKKRTLFRDQSELITLPTYYAKVVDVDSAGNIYFVATTKEGSSLFSLDGRAGQEKIIQRLTPSDVVVEARIFTQDKALVKEIGPEGYQYKIITLRPVREDPWAYTYFFEKVASLGTSALEGPPPPADTENTEIHTDQIRPYNHVSALRYESWQAQSLLGENGETFLQASFVDPLLQNSLQARVEFSHQEKEKLAKLLYANSRFRPTWFIGGTGVVQKKVPRTYPAPTPTTSSLEAGLTHFLGEWGHWKSLLMTEILYQDRRWNPWEYYLGVDLVKTRLFPLSFTVFDRTAFLMEGKTREWGEGEELAVQWQIQRDLGKENIIEHEARGEYSSTGEMEVGQAARSWTPLFPVQERFVFSSSTIKGAKLGLGYRKVINQGAYFPVFPLSLRRWAPRVFGNTFHYRYHRFITGQPLKLDYQEVGLGIQSEWLLSHLFPFKISMDWIRNIPSGKETFILSLIAN